MHEYTQEGDQYAPEFEISDGYEIWSCLGCDVASFRRWVSANGEVVDEQFYPPQTLGLASRKQFQKLGKKLATIYGEIIDAFNAGSHILCAGGLRALLEGICSDKRVSGDSLAAKIDQLTPRWVAKSVVKNLHSIRFLGNDALHDLDTDAEDVALAIEVVEDVLNAIYELDYNSGRLMQRLTEKKQANKDAAQRSSPEAKTKATAK